MTRPQPNRAITVNQSAEFVGVTSWLALLYFGFGYLAFLTSVPNGTLTPVVFAPGGMALAASILLGPRIWLGVFIGQVTLALSRNLAWEPAVAISAINAAEAVVGGLLFHRLKLSSTLSSMRDWVGLQLLIFFVLQACNATITMSVFWMFGLIQNFTEFSASWQNSWMGNCLGQSLLTPLLLVAWSVRRPMAARFWDIGLPVLVLLPVLWLTFFYSEEKGLAIPLVTIGDVLIFLAIYRRLFATTIGGVFVAVVFLYLTSRGLGPFVISGKTNLQNLNVFILGPALIAQFIAVLISERDKFSVGLSLAKQQAEHANLAKSKFLAAASHDLRQPVHAQGLFLELLGRTELTQQQREILTYARAASESSSQMLNTLLDFSRIEAGVIAPQVRPFLVQPLLNKLEQELAPKSDQKGLIYRTRETPLAVQSDPILVELILRNLITNAIRYTLRGGILVACRQRKNQVVLEVWDTGIGIATAHHGDIFREFHQLGNPERDADKGLGLGLAIAHGLADSLHGQLSVASTHHRGSVFRLALPMDIVPLALVPVGTLVAADLSLANRQLLIIDDNRAARISMCMLLRSWGCSCDGAESIEEALQLAQAHHPDMVISDLRLRDQRSGLDAITLLRSMLGSELPALLISADTAPDRLLETQARGIALLHKPVMPENLYRELVKLFDFNDHLAAVCCQPGVCT